MMHVYLAPLQGLTDWIYREAHSRYIGGVDKMFSPYVRVQSGEFYRPAQCRDLLPEQNIYQRPVPQFLGKDYASFRAFEALCEEYGYTEVNINMGCPYPMVAGKGMGARILNEPEKLRGLLDEVFAHTHMQVSVKCRLGMENADEFDAVAEILNQYPFCEVIVHPRTGKQQYKGHADVDAFIEKTKNLTARCCYNGDLLTVADKETVAEKWRNGSHWMCGRGILRNPFLGHELKGKVMTAKEQSEQLEQFHYYMLELCGRKYEQASQYMKRFEELWSYHSDWFADGRKLYKKVKKCKSITGYEDVLREATKMCADGAIVTENNSHTGG